MQANLERGFRRITCVASVVLFIAGGGLGILLGLDDLGLNSPLVISFALFGSCVEGFRIHFGCIETFITNCFYWHNFYPESG